MPPNFSHQVSFLRRQFSLHEFFFSARLFFGTTVFFGTTFCFRQFFWLGGGGGARLFVFGTIFFRHGQDRSPLTNIIVVVWSTWSLPGEGVIPYMGYIGTCPGIGYGF